MHRSRPAFGLRLRTIYRAVAVVTIGTFAAVSYFSLSLAGSQRQALVTNEHRAARIAALSETFRASQALATPGNDVFRSGDIAGESARLRAARQRFDTTLANARAGIVVPELRARLDRAGLHARELVRITNNVFEIVGRRDDQAAVAALRELAREHARLDAELAATRNGLRSRQLVEFRAERQHIESLARNEKIALVALWVLVAAFVGFGRLLGREESNAAERERYIGTLNEREKQLARKSQLLEDGQRLASMGSYEMNFETGELWWSDSLYAQFGFAPGEVTLSFEFFLSRVAPRHRARVGAVVEQAKLDHKPWYHQFAIIQPDGSERMCASSGRITVGEDGRAIGFSGVAQDITEMKWAEDRLLGQEAQLAEAQQVAKMGSWSMEVSTQTVEWSDELFALLGYASGEVSPTPAAYLDLLSPEERRRVVAKLNSAISAGETRFEIEHAMTRRDGEQIMMAVRAVIHRDAEGLVERIIGVSQDMTEQRRNEQALRQSEERFQLASRATNDVIWDWDLTTGALWISEGYSRQFGYDHWGPLESDEGVANIHPDDVDRVMTTIAGAIETGLSSWSVEYRYRDASGAWRDVLDRGYIVRGADGKATRALGAMTDITARRAVERMKDEFVSTVSHELRTPLTSIRGALGLLSTGRVGMLPEKGQRLLDIAAANTDRLVRLINDILDIERIESGKATLVKVEVDGAELAAQALDVVRGIADKAEVALELQASPSRLVADPDRIVQTLTNLLGNAVKFSDRGSVVTLNVEPRGQDVVFTVTDRGRGIPADKLDSIFERFQQVDASDARDKGGSGLGLAISRGLVRQHGGEISVASTVGRGTTFTVALPSGVTPHGSAAEEKVIFVCDDDPEMCDMLDFMLSERGYRVVETDCGEALLIALESERPDVILLDLFMPDMNGWETLARIRSNPATAYVPVIVVSVLSPDEITPPALELSGWLQKPLDGHALTTVLERALREKPRRPRLMLVEDDEDLASVIVSSFERYGIETVHARSGEEAIALASRIDPDLLILDLVLPGADGYAVIDWLKDHETWRGLPLVVYSASEPSPSERDRLRLGPTEFLTKSRITPEDFEHRIVALLDSLTTETGAVGNAA